MGLAACLSTNFRSRDGRAGPAGMRSLERYGDGGYSVTGPARMGGRLRALLRPETPSGPASFSEAELPTIGVIAGDGVGPEVVREGLAVLEEAAKREGFRYDLK